MIKEIQIWFKSLQRRGKIVAGIAAVGLIWLLVSLLNILTGNSWLSFINGWLQIFLTILSMILVSLVVAQFLLMGKMRANMKAQAEAMAMRGQRGGNPMEQLSGRRTAASMRRGGKGKGDAMTQAMSAFQIPAADLDKRLSAISPSLDGVEFVDDKDAKANGYKDEIIWESYGLIDFYPIVHYKSDHPESELVDKELEYIKSKNIKYKTLRDGETIVINN